MGRKKLKNSPTISQRVAKWAKENSRIIQLRLNKKSDADVIARLEAQPNKTSYIVELIRKDLGIEQAPLITLADLSKELSDNEKARLELDGGVVWHASKRDIENDTRIVKEWHRNEDNIICAKVKAR